MKKIFLNGCYGACNIGDDIMMSITINDIEAIFNKEVEINIKNKGNKKCLLPNNKRVNNLFNLSKMYELKLIANSDLYIWGGGTFLYESTDNGLKSLLSIMLHILIAKIFKTKIVLYGIGFGPFKSSIGKQLGSLIIKLSDFITVRDNESYNQIRQINTKSFHTNDLVYRLNIEKVNDLRIEENTSNIVINTVYHQNNDDIKKFANIIINEIEKQNIAKKNIHLHLIAAWESETISDNKTNIVLLEFLLKEYDFKYTVHENKNTEELLSIIKSSSSVFAQRLHILLIAILFKKDIFTYEYHSKIKKFLNSIKYKNGKYDKNCVLENIKQSETNLEYLKEIMK